MRSTLLSIFLSVQYVIVDYRYNAAGEVCRAYSSCLSEALGLVISNSPFLAPPNP